MDSMQSVCAILAAMLDPVIDVVSLHGGCHCRAVRYVVTVPRVFTALDCNCSICRMSGFLHLIVPARRFVLTQGSEVLATYTFNSGVAQHRFCRACGVKSFYIPRSNPDGIDVNVRCLDAGQRYDMTVEPFDGVDWEAHGAALASLSTGSTGT